MFAILNVPLAHDEQVRSVVAVPSLVTHVPGAHTLSAAQGVAGLPSWSQVPAAHVVCRLVPPAQYCPATHASHTAAEVDVPAAVCTVPAAHEPCSWQLDWLVPLEYWPLGHAVHTRSTVAEAVLLTKVPAGHVVHAVHAAALLPVLNCPLAHEAHTRSAMALPSAETNVPGLHEVISTHGVAALPS